MNEYKVEITETLQRIIMINAANEDDALVKIKEMYRAEDVVLDSSDFIDTDFNITRA
jgi:hypothetical protein